MAMQSPNKNHKERFTAADPVEEEMFQLVADIRPVPPRSPEKSAQTRARFTTALDAAGLPERQPARSGQKWLRILPFGPRKPATTPRDDEENDMSKPVQRFAFSTIILFALVAALLFGGAGSTVAASSNAIPGDALYGVKTSLEQTRASLAGSAGDRAALYLEFADRRMDEIARLIDQGRYDEVAGTTDVYETYLNKAIAEIQTLAHDDPQRAALLAADVSSSLARYAQALSNMVDSVPAAVKDDVQRALQTTQRAGGTDDDGTPGAATSGDDGAQDEIEFSGEVTQINGELWTIGGKQVTVTALTEMKNQISLGSQVKVHAFLGASGALIVREMELTGAGVDDDDDGRLDDDRDDDDRDDMNDDDRGGDDSSDDDSGPSMGDDDDSDDNSGSGSDDSSDDDHSDDDSDDDDSGDDSDDDSDDSDDSDDDHGDDD